MSKLREIRLRNDLTQVQLAERMGVKQCTVSQWELGLSQPSADNIRRLCFLLNCSSDELLGIATNRELA